MRTELRRAELGEAAEEAAQTKGVNQARDLRDYKVRIQLMLREWPHAATVFMSKGSQASDGVLVSVQSRSSAALAVHKCKQCSRGGIRVRRDSLAHRV